MCGRVHRTNTRRTPTDQTHFPHFRVIPLSVRHTTKTSSTPVACERPHASSSQRRSKRKQSKNEILLIFLYARARPVMMWAALCVHINVAGPNYFHAPCVAGMRFRCVRRVGPRNEARKRRVLRAQENEVYRLIWKEGPWGRGG